MADLKKNNDLNSLKGHLGRAFRGSRANAQQKLDTLQKLFLAAATPENHAAAVAALNQFQQAARRLHISENAFNRRARPQQGSTPTLLKHLRTPEQFVAVRAFSAAKHSLLAINADIGRRIVHLAAAQQDSMVVETAAPKPAAVSLRP